MVQAKILPSAVQSLNGTFQAAPPERVPEGKVTLVKNTKSSSRLKVYYSVIHETPGRLRLRVPHLKEDAEYAQRLLSLIEADKYVTSVKVKPAAASLTVNYEPSFGNTALMRAHIGHILQAATDVAVLKTKKVSAPASVEDSSIPSWKFSAVAATLAVLGGPLGLSISPLLTASTIALATLPVAKRAFSAIYNERKFNIEFLDFMAIAITTVQGQFLTPALMLGLIEIGENIRDRTARSSAQQTLDLLSSLGQFAWVERDGEKVQVPIEEVEKGDTVIVYPGEQVPVDGTILRGQALFDEQKLTGESMPVSKREGQAVYASSLVREGQIYIVAERVGNDTCVGKTIELMQQAPVHDTRMENYAAKIAEKAVVPTLLLSASVFALSRNPARAASILTLDFATGIRVCVPTTVLAALTYAARRGILIRSGRALEQLASIDTIVFDKTGTLTKGEIGVTNVRSFNSEVSANYVLALAATAEMRLTHPVAEAVVRHAEQEQIDFLTREKWEYQLGLGVEAIIDGKLVYVGSERFLRQENVDMSALDALEEKAASAIFVATNGELQGIIEHSDVVRPESKKVVQSLLTVEGIDVHMLTGDNKRTASAVAAELGISPKNTHAEAFPEQKADVVQQLHAEGKTVAFVGDGVNDSAALAFADVSVSFANGSDIARETADLVLMNNDLQGLLEAIEVARKAKQLIKQNTSIIAIPNLAALVVAAIFGLNPLTATVVNNGSTVVAGVNALRPMLKKSAE
ncbi:heavy metal translocating P-type ATPase [Calothrix sp. PCC 7716]|mgnify:CR=1 FL=1|nr:heavy metal translocating P-type ATPase [Calothrix sp. PCC 7716]